MKKLFILVSLFAAFVMPTCAQQPSFNTLFFEAEDFVTSSNGWKVQDNSTVKRASRATVLSGSSGKSNGVATKEITIPQAGTWRIWVRYMEHSRYRGPFVVDVLSGTKVLLSHDFGLEPQKDVPNWGFAWDYVDIALDPGTYTLRLRKYKNKNSTGYARKVDAFLLTTDLELKPSIVPYGPQTWMKVTLGDGYKEPIQIHIFADHYRSPWYAHYSLTKGHVDSGVRPTKEHVKDKLSNGESTGWLNISEMIYQDSGAHLVIYPAYTYWNHAETFDATIAFANKPNDSAAVKTFEIDYTPSTLHVVMPPNLETKVNIAKLRRDLDFANQYGKIADHYDWTQIGKKPVQFPFFVSAKLRPNKMARKVVERELKTLSYFGFNGIGNSTFFEQYGYNHKSIGGVGWYYDDVYSAPDLERIQKKADAEYQSQIKAGIDGEDIAYAMVMDEPTGMPLSRIADNKASNAGFVKWLKSKKLTPQELLVKSWDEVRLVTEKEKSTFPALYYYSQKYRTIALGNFLTIQKEQLQKHWKSTFPIVANFSDGAIYYANFYGQGVDYFALLHQTDQNAIWSEDWSNGAATYQDASFNVELMRAAARKHGQTLGHHLITYAGRTGYDVRLKAVSEAARGVKIFDSFAYGPVWAGHEHSVWQENTPLWGEVASAVHEIGAVEDLLLPAMPQKAEVALLYSSASDIWNLENLVYGFERMHTWLALTHAQIPVDVVHESAVADGFLDEYKVAYLSDPNITRAAAQKLADWVKAGGTLIMTAGAGERDEYNRPLDTLNNLLPYKRNPAQTLQNYHSSGSRLTYLKPQGTVTSGNAKIDVLGVKQTFANVNNSAQIKSTFTDGLPASIRSDAGKGYVICKGYLPAIDYIRDALVAKNGVEELDKKLDEDNGIPSADEIQPLKINEKSYNPWEYPAAVREAIIAPVLAANVETPITCNVPLVDAVYMTSDKGIVIPLANYTLQPIKNMTLEITVNRPFSEVRSVHQGVLKYDKIGNNKIRINLPLECTDFVTIR